MKHYNLLKFVSLIYGQARDLVCCLEKRIVFSEN
jgi:hypothetical protein